MSIVLLQRIETAVAKVIREGKTVTRDINPDNSQYR
jgi:hypothetical protein